MFYWKLHHKIHLKPHPTLGIFSISSLVKILKESFPAFHSCLSKQSVCPFNRKDNNRVARRYEFYFLMLKTTFLIILSLCSFIDTKYCFCYSKIKFISLQPHVMYSIYWYSVHPTRQRFPSLILLGERVSLCLQSPDRLINCHAQPGTKLSIYETTGNICCPVSGYKITVGITTM